MEYMNYKKSFVMLEEQNRSFALDKKRPVKGYLKIETGRNRGAVRVGAENLRCFEQDAYVYKLIFFGKKNEKTIYKIMGTLLISSRGRGETYLKMNPVDLDGNGNSLNCFTIATVVAVSMTDRREPLHPVLRAAIEKRERCMCPKDYGTFNHFYNQHVIQCCQEIENKRELYHKTIPFKHDRTGADWRRVVNLGRFPLVSPDGQYMITRYRHFIFGTDDTYYYIGVPGRYLEKEQPEQGKSGFVLWQPIMGAEAYGADEEGASMECRQVAYGYWIAAINKESGTIEDLWT